MDVDGDGDVKEILHQRVSLQVVRCQVLRNFPETEIDVAIRRVAPRNLSDSAQGRRRTAQLVVHQSFVCSHLVAPAFEELFREGLLQRFCESL